MDYRWEFGPIDTKISENGLTKVVYNVHWRLIGTDKEYRAEVYGSCGVTPPLPNVFTPYEKLTKGQVQGWVETILGSEQVSEYKDVIAKNIDLQKNPVDASLQPPWSGQ